MFNSASEPTIKLTWARLLYFQIVLPILKRIPVSSVFFGPVKGCHPSLRAWACGSKSQGIRRKSDSKDTVVKVTCCNKVDKKTPVVSIPGMPKGIQLARVHQRLPTCVAHLRWCRIATRQFEVISRDDRVFSDLFLNNSNPYPAQSLILPWLPRMERRFGRYATIGMSRTANYCHWINDCLSRLWLLELSGLSDYRLIVPKVLTHFQRDSLELLGYGGDRLAHFGQEHWCVEELIVPSLVNQAYESCPGAAKWLRHKFLTRLPPSQERKSYQRLYISRARAAKKRLINEEEVVRFLRNHGFHSVEMENMSMANQIQLSHGAEVIMGPHGAGLMNALFMKEGRTVIELTSYRRAKPMFYNLANSIGLKYVCISNAPEKAYEESELGSTHRDVGFAIPVSRIERALRALGI